MMDESMVVVKGSQEHFIDPAGTDKNYCSCASAVILFPSGDRFWFRWWDMSDTN